MRALSLTRCIGVALVGGALACAHNQETGRAVVQDSTKAMGDTAMRNSQQPDTSSYNSGATRRDTTAPRDTTMSWTDTTRKPADSLRMPHDTMHHDSMGKRYGSDTRSG